MASIISPKIAFCSANPFSRRVSGVVVVNPSDFRGDAEYGLGELRVVECSPRTSALALQGWLGLTRRVRLVSVGALEGQHGALTNPLI